MVLTFEGETPVMEMFQYPRGCEVVLEKLGVPVEDVYNVSIPVRVRCGSTSFI